MRIDRLIGSTGVRLAAGGFALLAAFLFWRYAGGATAAKAGWLLAAAIVLTILAFLALVHSARPIYDRWMQFATLLHEGVITLLFGVVYLVVVPPFSLIMRRLDPLRLRRLDETTTFWVERSPRAIDLESLERMG